MTVQNSGRPWRWFTSFELLLFLLVLLALATRLPFLTHSLDEFDSANFATGLIKFQLRLSDPHPPGQLYYILLGRGVNFFVGDELTTLSLASALFSCLALVPMFYLLRLVYAGNGRLALATAALTAFSYAYWLTGLRPISDPVGCFFVYATLCALLYGVDSAVWFCAGMALFSLTLGIKQLTLYFLAPVVVVSNLMALRKHGWRPVLIGAVLFAAIFLGWLIPSMRNCGGWNPYLDGCRKAVQWGYANESLITHRTWERLDLQVQHNLLQPWGSTAVAWPILVLAAIGAWRAAWLGPKAVLYLVFGLSTIVYIFLIQYVFGKYNMYYMPIYCGFAVLGLDTLSRRLQRFVEPAAFFNTIILLLIGCGLGATFPLLARVPGFRTPVEAIGEQLVALSRHHPNIAVMTDNEIVSNDLKYYVRKGNFVYAHSYDYLETAHLLSSSRQLFLLSAEPSNGLESNLVTVSHFHWDDWLYDIFEGRESMRDLYLYELKTPLAREFAFTGVHRLPQPFLKGIDADGWAHDHVSVLLPVDSALSPILHLAGVAPKEPALNYPYHVRYAAEGVAPAEFQIDRAGPFNVDVPLVRASGPKELSIELWLPQSFQPAKVEPGATDARDLTLQFTHLETSTLAQPMFIEQGAGWYDRESDGKDWWYWSPAEGTMEVATERPGTLIVTGQFDPVTPGNTIDVSLDGQVAETLDPVNIDWTPETLRIPVVPGIHFVTFRSRQPGMHPPNDSRTLALGVKNLNFYLD